MNAHVHWTSARVACSTLSEIVEIRQKSKQKKQAKTKNWLRRRVFVFRHVGAWNRLGRAKKIWSIYLKNNYILIKSSAKFDAGELAITTARLEEKLWERPQGVRCYACFLMAILCVDRDRTVTCYKSNGYAFYLCSDRSEESLQDLNDPLPSCSSDHQNGPYPLKFWIWVPVKTNTTLSF